MQITFVAALAAFLGIATGIPLDINDTASIKNASATLAFGLQSWYHTNVTGVPATAIGTLDPPLYWWQAGAMWGGMIDYWAYTNDTSYNAVITQALMAQVGPDNNYMPPAYYPSLGNDDQAFWALAVLSALEYGFPPPSGQSPDIWLDLAVAVFNTQAPRWNTEACGGGLKWQIFESNAGYNYRNAISNGGLLQMSARLARYTGNQTYVDWAEKSWEWMSRIGLIGANYQVYDGSDDKINCSEINHIQWSYNPAMLLYGAASMANLTNSAVWQQRTEGLLTSTLNTFFSPFPNATSIMYEAACEPGGTCNNDQVSFKAYLSRWMSKSAKVYPSITAVARKYIGASAEAAAASCSGGDNGQTCGQKWYVGGYDGIYGVGQQMSALETVQSLLLLDGTAVRSIPRHQGNISIQTVTLEQFPLDPPSKAPVSPGSPPNGRGGGISAASANFGDRGAMNALAVWLGLVTLSSMALGSGFGRLW